MSFLEQLKSFDTDKLVATTTFVHEHRESAPLELIPETPFVWDNLPKTHALPNRDRGTNSEPITIGVLKEEGLCKASFDAVNRLVQSNDSWSVLQMTPEDIENGSLIENSINVFIMAGGAHRPTLMRLHDQGRKNFISFIQDGGGYIGICGGAFFAWHLGIVSVHCRGSIFQNDKFQGVQGKSRVEFISDNIVFNSKGGDISRMAELSFNNGPLFLPKLFDRGLPDWFPLAYYKNDLCAVENSRMDSMISGEIRSDGLWSCYRCTVDNEGTSDACSVCFTNRQSWEEDPGVQDLVENRPPVGLMENSPAIIGSVFGEGKLVLFSPHPELSVGYESLLFEAIDYVLK
eukprot:TRINITY_DN8342_c0_g1_i1.p1 TRINITY_DN8342_c0_g1~~TRINITY_DN8342_c0_g1_i1.p1  ORF type:complete len:346 (+),score=61.96 TRINITY_DN8342_c0_g1_i1:61-1098(+)